MTALTATFLPKEFVSFEGTPTEKHILNFIGSLPFGLLMSYKAMADKLGISTKTCTRCIKSLLGKGVLFKEGKKHLKLNREALIQLNSGDTEASPASPHGLSHEADRTLVKSANVNNNTYKNNIKTSFKKFPTDIEKGIDKLWELCGKIQKRDILSVFENENKNKKGTFCPFAGSKKGHFVHPIYIYNIDYIQYINSRSATFAVMVKDSRIVNVRKVPQGCKFVLANADAHADANAENKKINNYSLDKNLSFRTEPKPSFSAKPKTQGFKAKPMASCAPVESSISVYEVRETLETKHKIPSEFSQAMALEIYEHFTKDGRNWKKGSEAITLESLWKSCYPWVKAFREQHPEFDPTKIKKQKTQAKSSNGFRKIISNAFGFGQSPKSKEITSVPQSLYGEALMPADELDWCSRNFATLTKEQQALVIHQSELSAQMAFGGNTDNANTTPFECQSSMSAFVRF